MNRQDKRKSQAQKRQETQAQSKESTGSHVQSSAGQTRRPSQEKQMPFTNQVQKSSSQAQRFSQKSQVQKSSQEHDLTRKLTNTPISPIYSSTLASFSERHKNIRFPSVYDENEVETERNEATLLSRKRDLAEGSDSRNNYDLLLSENLELKNKLSELCKKSSQLEQQNKELVRKSQEDNEVLTNINWQFGEENDRLKKEIEELNMKLEQYQRFRLPSPLQYQMTDEFDDNQTAKRRKPFKKSNKKSNKKGKKPMRYSDDEEESEENSDDVIEAEEPNEAKARVEMKTILKTIDKKQDLDYESTFSSDKNLDIRRRLVPELQKSMAPNYHPSAGQLTKWLKSIHKSRHSHSIMMKSGKVPQDQRRIHLNNRLNDKKIRRIKAAKDLYKKNDGRITKYEKRPLMKILADRFYHSPEVSETDEETDESKICVYDYSWRSVELKDLLRKVLDPHSLTIQTAHLQRNRHYDDELQHYDRPNPPNAPLWTYVEQQDIDDTEIERYIEDHSTEEEAVLLTGERVTEGTSKDVDQQLVDSEMDD